MHHEWQRPTADEQQRGIVAWYVQVNTFKPDVQPCPYYAHHMERRVARWRKDNRVSLPHWKLELSA